jgi:hypothetical protein
LHFSQSFPSAHPWPRSLFPLQSDRNEFNVLSCPHPKRRTPALHALRARSCKSSSTSNMFCRGFKSSVLIVA